MGCCERWAVNLLALWYVLILAVNAGAFEGRPRGGVAPVPLSASEVAAERMFATWRADWRSCRAGKRSPPSPSGAPTG